MTATNTVFLDNHTSGGGSTMVFAGDNLRLVNSLLANNATLAGALTLGGNAQVLHTTFAQPITGTGAAISVVTGTVGVTDTIIASYTLGIQHTAAGSVRENYNLFFGNGANTQGSVTSGGNSISGTTKFVNPLGGDYHLSAGSAAIDTGVNVGVTTDYDGQPRPIGGGYDIGFDEYINLPKKLFLPEVIR